MTPFDAALSIPDTAVLRRACASFTFLPPIAARSRLMTVRMAVFWAVLRAVRRMRCRFAFSADLRFAILRRASWLGQPPLSRRGPLSLTLSPLRGARGPDFLARGPDL